MVSKAERRNGNTKRNEPNEKETVTYETKRNENTVNPYQSQRIVFELDLELVHEEGGETLECVLEQLIHPLLPNGNVFALQFDHGAVVLLDD